MALVRLSGGAARPTAPTSEVIPVPLTPMPSRTPLSMRSKPALGRVHDVHARHGRKRTGHDHASGAVAIGHHAGEHGAEAPHQIGDRHGGGERLAADAKLLASWAAGKGPSPAAAPWRSPKISPAARMTSHKGWRVAMTAKPAFALSRSCTVRRRTLQAGAERTQTKSRAIAQIFLRSDMTFAHASISWRRSISPIAPSGAQRARPMSSTRQGGPSMR